MTFPTIMMMTLSIIGAGLTGVIAYGAIVKKRHLILTGLFFYSFLPIIGETMGLVTTGHPYHVLFIGLFLVQLLISSIRTVPFDPTDTTLNEYTKRMGGSLIIINLVSALFVLVISNDYPAYIGGFHLIIALSLCYGVYQRLRGNLSH